MSSSLGLREGRERRPGGDHPHRGADTNPDPVFVAIDKLGMHGSEHVIPRARVDETEQTPIVDHPFSPIIDLDVPRLRQLAAAGVYLNWTYDELSPLLGVDPQDIVAAIEAVGPEHCLLSSDAGDPVLPHSVESMRLLAATLESYGLPRAAVRQMAATNPSRIMGLAAPSRARAA